MLSPFLLSAVQRRLITAEAPNLLPSPLPLPRPLIGLKTLYSEFALFPWRYVYGKVGTMAASGTGPTAAAGAPCSKDLKGDCSAGGAPEQQQHHQPGALLQTHTADRNDSSCSFELLAAAQRQHEVRDHS